MTGVKRYSQIELATQANNPYVANMLTFGGGKTRLTSQDVLLLERGGSAKALDVYLDLLTDYKVYAALDKQISEIVTRHIVLKAGGKSPADIAAYEFCKEQLALLGTTTDDSFGYAALLESDCGYNSLERALLLAVLTGISAAEIVWSSDSQGRVVPKKLKVVDPRRLVFFTDEKGNVFPKLLTRNSPFDGVYMPSRKFIIHRHWSLPIDDPYGQGVGRQLYYPVQWKRELLTIWLNLVDKHADPPIVVTVPEELYEDEEKREQFSADLRRLGRDMNIIVPDGVIVAPLKIDYASGTQSANELVEKCDDAISLAFLGECTTGEKDGGSQARETINNSIRLQKASAWSVAVSETINNTLLSWMTFFNFPPGTKPPKVSRNFTDIESILDVATKLSQMRLGLDPDYIEDALGMPLLKGS